MVVVELVVFDEGVVVAIGYSMGGDFALDLGGPINSHSELFYFSSQISE